MPVFTALSSISLAAGLASAGAVGGLAGGTISAIGAVQANEASKKAARAAIQEGRIAASIEGEKGRRLASAQEAATGASGLTGASPLLFRIQSAYDSLIEQNRIMTGARSRASAFREQGKQALFSGVASSVSQFGTAFTNLGLIARDA